MLPNVAGSARDQQPGIMQSSVLHEPLGIADDQVVMKSIAPGLLPDETFPANTLMMVRKSAEEHGDCRV
jgi:hypothetical protein